MYYYTLNTREMYAHPFFVCTQYQPLAGMAFSYCRSNNHCCRMYFHLRKQNSLLMDRCGYGSDLLWSGSFFSCLRYTGAWAYLNNNSVYCYTINNRKHNMVSLFLFLSLLILLIRRFSARLIIPAVCVFLPVSSLWMGFTMLKQHESPCQNSSGCVLSPFAQFSTLLGWLFIAVSILTTCACVCFLRKNKKFWSWHDAPMLLLAGGLAICGTWMLELLEL
ncbi:hypothetical protein HEN27_021350 [Escherichia coli]|nr:hypothetical protein [Escherichia coli]MBB7212062.1 hypothetical protein [Escherichia coli]HBD5374803.1 hypothetical protein [Escherichia coli]HBE2980910.1 hypothetical protein [Escherichia coli]HCT0794292.1 hypothetical protein [Salmonella enterica subsp. enterica serovar Infantis]